MPGTDPRYAPLFEPIRIGPKTAKNRFYQVPHCNGMGWNYLSSMARMRGIKGEGGWGVVCTERCCIHWTPDATRELRMLDDQDVPILLRMAEEVHRHDALACLQAHAHGILWAQPHQPRDHHDADRTADRKRFPRRLPDHGQDRHPKSPALIPKRRAQGEEDRL